MAWIIRRMDNDPPRARWVLEWKAEGLMALAEKEPK